MGMLNIAPASRKGMRFLVSLYGMSESGKTLSALLLAAGMEPDPRKRLLLDSEGGQRGRAYVDEVPGGYMYANLTPPFTPERYLEAVNEIEAAGINVCVIDSFSHVWIAEGGVLDMIEEDTATRNDMAKWAKPKRRHYKLVRRILATDMHVILCSRAKQPLVEVMEGGKKKLVPGPIRPVQEKTLRYDMTVMALMLGKGRYTVEGGDGEGGKCPGALRHIFDGQGVMNQAMGQNLIRWLGEQDRQSGDLRLLRIAGEEAAAKGADEFAKWWNSPEVKPHREALRTNLGNFQSIARQADEDKSRKEEEERDRASLDNPFGRGDQSEQGSENAIPVLDHDGRLAVRASNPHAWADAYIERAKACSTDQQLDALFDHNRAVLADLDDENADRVSNAMKLLRGPVVTIGPATREPSLALGGQ